MAAFVLIWELPKIRGTLFWGPYTEDPTIKGPRLGSPIVGNSHLGARYAPNEVWPTDYFSTRTAPVIADLLPRHNIGPK